MERHSARLRALATLVFADIALKALARAFLRARDVPLLGPGRFRLGYVENASGFGYEQTRLLARYGVAIDDAFVVCTLVVFLVLALAVHLWHRIGGKPWIKSLAGIAVYLVAAAIMLALHDSMSLSLSSYLRGLLRAIGPLAVALVLYVEVERPYYAFLSLLFLAGTIGNCFSLILPPFVVIDYFGIYRPSIGIYVYANAADAYLVVAMALIALIPVYLLVRRLHGRA